VRIYSIASVRKRKVFNHALVFCFIILSLPVSNGGSNRLNLDPIDDLLALPEEELLEEVQRATFRYFWDFAHPVSGLIRERNTSGDLVTSGGSGFGIMAIIVGIHRNFITRAEGLARLQTIVEFLGQADRFHGAWSHWLNGNTGSAIPFSARDDGGDLVETSFLLQGLLTARMYFDLDTPEELALRSHITELYEDVDWNWYRRQVNQFLLWHWSPNHGFAINLPIRGWNETMIAYILGIASPTHQLPASTYRRGWAGDNYINNETFYGYKLEVGNDTGGPLFFTHYSFLGLDPRDKRDDYANYFFQGRNQALINQAWCNDNPKGFAGYSNLCWGLTASDDPDGYKAHAPNIEADNGTITPSAAISSIVYTPQESIAAIRHFLTTYGEKVWGPMGFYDAFNPSRDWYADSYLAIDQGPIICMIENYRSGLLWDYFMRNEEINTALNAIGFSPDSATTSNLITKHIALHVYPNPSNGTFYLKSENQRLKIASVTDITGKSVPYESNLESDFINIKVSDLVRPGVILLSIKHDNKIISKKLILNPIE
ncbi:MAG: T9SS type A sorting domain-containing protein, partial [Saprospiraceae bacterium]|nr:T9SS type A sorting domain-containing protein [Saprospiraceae bacterium]